LNFHWLVLLAGFSGRRGQVISGKGLQLMGTLKTAIRAVLLFAFVLSGCAPHPAATSLKPQIDVSHVTARTDTSFLMRPGAFRVYSLLDGDTHAQLRIVPATGSAVPELLLSVWRGSGAESFAPDPGISIQRRMQFFVPLFQKYLQEGGPGNRFELFVYGAREWDRRLTCLAAQDPGWDRKKGQPIQPQSGYNYYEHLLEKGDAYREVRQALEPLHYRVTLTGGLEKVIVAPVASFSMESHAGLCGAVQDSDLLPVRLTVTFTVTEMPH
jgi:hypothetical protein